MGEEGKEAWGGGGRRKTVMDRSLGQIPLLDQFHNTSNHLWPSITHQPLAEVGRGPDWYTVSMYRASFDHHNHESMLYLHRHMYIIMADFINSCSGKVVALIEFA